jgi:hypothetical protein
MATAAINSPTNMMTAILADIEGIDPILLITCSTAEPPTASKTRAFLRSAGLATNVRIKQARSCAAASSERTPTAKQYMY